MYIPANSVDLGALIKKMEAKMTKAQNEKAKLEIMLENANFIKNAPQHLVDSNRNALEEAKTRLEKLSVELDSLKNIRN